MTEIRATPGGTPKVSRDATANDSDKTVLTVPTGKVVRLTRVYAQLTATATVGNRILRCVITNGTDPIWVSPSPGNIAASQVGAIELDTSFADYVATIPVTDLAQSVNLNAKATCFMPDMLLLAGFVVRVADMPAIDAAADDLTTVIHYIEYDA